MSKFSKYQLIVLLLAVVFIFGIIRLFALRFEHGDIYPAYSSLRHDPLGAAAFYKALEQSDAISADRNYIPPSRLNVEGPFTIFYLGLQAYQLDSVPKEFLDIFDQILSTGGRIVLTLLPENSAPPVYCKKCKLVSKKDKKEKEAAAKGAKADAKSAKTSPSAEPGESSDSDKPLDGDNPVDSEPQKEEKKEEAPAEPPKYKSLLDHWDIGLGFNETWSETLKKEGSGPVVAEFVEISEDPVNPQSDMPKSISWHSGLHFRELSENFRACYNLDGKPVLIEGRIGDGTVILATDSYFTSNEAMRNERHSSLLAWLVGPNANVSFDEFHLGIQKSPGIVNLIRKYNLHGIVFTFLLLAVLFIWKNAGYFIPPADTAQNRRSGQGYSVLSNRDATEGLITLLRKNIKSDKIVAMCVSEWEKTVQTDPTAFPFPISDEDLGRVRNALNRLSAKTDRKVIVETFQDILNYMQQKKTIKNRPLKT